MRFVTCLLILPLCAAAQTTLPLAFPENATAVGDEALRTRMSGKVFRATLHDGSTWRLEYKANGYAFVNTGTGYRDTGQWRAQDGKLCLEWRQAPSGCSETRADVDAVYIKRISTGEVVALKSE